MAEKQPKKAKRVVKNPETFRERALKANELDDSPSRLAGIKRAGGKLASPVAVPAGKLSGFTPLKPVIIFFRLIGKILMPPYIRSSWRELRQVTWPSWSESRRLTWAVLVFSLAFGLAVAAVDYGLDKIFKRLFVS